MSGFVKVSENVFVDELDVKQVFEQAEDRLSVLDFDVPKYVVEFTLESVLMKRDFAHLSQYEKKAIVEYIVDNY